MKSNIRLNFYEMLMPGAESRLTRDSNFEQLTSHNFV